MPAFDPPKGFTTNIATVDNSPRKSFDSWNGDMNISSGGGQNVEEAIMRHLRKLPDPRMRQPKEGEHYTRIFAILPRLADPSAYVSEIGLHVHEEFKSAWRELVSPAYGDRAIYWTYAPTTEDSMLVRKDEPPIVNVRLSGWSLLVPDDLNVLKMEAALAGEPFAMSNHRDPASWYQQMVDRLAELEGVNGPGDIIEFIFEFLPPQLGKPLQESINHLHLEIERKQRQLVEMEQAFRHHQQTLAPVPRSMLTGQPMAPKAPSPEGEPSIEDARRLALMGAIRDMK